MKNLSKIIILLLAYISSIDSLLAQISTGEKPVSFNFELKYDSKLTKIMPNIDIQKLQEEDAINEGIVDFYRFGYSHIVDFNLENSGQWFTLPNGDKLWQLQIVCPNALSINLTYDKFWLPEDVKFFIYSNDKKQNVGAFTSKNNKGNKDDIQGFATTLLYSDTIVLEYYSPKEVKDIGIICIDTIVHGYRSILQNANSSYKEKESFQGLPICAVDINCSEGDDWQNEKRAVALMMVGNRVMGTGSLVNNTNNDFTPYFLTAKHVTDGYVNFNKWIFCWNYENVGCNKNGDTLTKNLNYSTNGATLCANNHTTDFTLLVLTEHPAHITAGYKPYYLGWDRTGNAGSYNGACIHHPNGYPKKISIYNGTPITSNCTNLTGTTNTHIANNFWLVGFIDAGSGNSYTSGGSSGSALINNDKHIIGQLLGGNACSPNLCSGYQTAYSNYGKFHLSWTGGGTNSTRLSNWLDPTNTGETVLDGVDHCWQTTLTGTQPPAPTTYKRVICEEINVEDVTVPVGVTLELKATRRVIINSGFTVEAGAIFIVR